jgi:hypothetical protein
MNFSSLKGPRRTSRRHFMRTTAAAIGTGAVVGSGLWRSVLAAAKGSADPKPIPGGTPGLGGAFHVYGPGLPGADPPDSEPSTITDFNGVVGLAFISGSVERTRISTGEKDILPFLFSDMRFMKGVFRGTDGRTRRGAFAFI